MAEKLLEGLNPQHVVADAASDSNAIREQIHRSGGTACIPPDPTRKIQKRYDKKRYKHRNVIERFFGGMKRNSSSTDLTDTQWERISHWVP